MPKPEPKLGSAVPPPSENDHLESLAEALKEVEAEATAKQGARDIGIENARPL